jgi:hypothetical protein
MIFTSAFFCKPWNSSDLEENVSTIPKELLAYPYSGSYGSLMRNPFIAIVWFILETL